MVGIQQESPLEFWDKRVQYKIRKNKSVQRIRKGLIRERQKHENKIRKQNKENNWL